MTADNVGREHWTLEELAFDFGPVELYRPVSREEFLSIAERNPNLQLERDPNREP